MRQTKIFILIFLLVISCEKKGLNVRKVTKDEIGKEVVCPVMKNEFNVSEETRVVDYKGKTYYFCCPGCEPKFIKEPEKYISKEVKKETREEGVSEEILYWTCSMHPQVRSDKPGKCPICAMALISVYKGEEDKIIVEEEKAKVLGIKSEAVETRYLTKTIRLPGKVAYDNELYLAQQEYLSSLKTWLKIKDMETEQKNRIKETLEAAKFRLSLLGYTEKDIKRLEESGDVDKTLIYPGERVWVHADVYEYDLNVVKPDQKVSLTTPAYPGKSFIGKVCFVEPALNSQTRSAKARIEVKNTQNLLSLGLYTDLEIKVSLGKCLVIPRTALINTGTRKIVYLDLGNNRYKWQEVTTGVEAKGYIQVLSGVKEGDLVVAEGNFLLDSQSTLTGGQSLLYGAAEEIKEKLSKKEGEH